MNILPSGAPWLSGRVSDSGARGQGFDTYLCRVVSLSKDTFTPRKVLVIPRKRWLCSHMTEKLLTGTLSINTKKHFAEAGNGYTVNQLCLENRAICGAQQTQKSVFFLSDRGYM